MQLEIYYIHKYTLGEKMELTVKQAAEKVYRNEKTIRTWIKQGNIKAHKENNCWKVSFDSLENYLNANNGQRCQTFVMDSESISLIASKVSCEVRHVFKEVVIGRVDQQEPCLEVEIQSVQKENEVLKERISSLETELETIKASFKDIVLRFEKQDSLGQEGKDFSESEEENTEVRYGAGLKLK